MFSKGGDRNYLNLQVPINLAYMMFLEHSVIDCMFTGFMDTTQHWLLFIFISYVMAALLALRITSEVRSNSAFIRELPIFKWFLRSLVATRGVTHSLYLLSTARHHTSILTSHCHISFQFLSVLLL